MRLLMAVGLWIAVMAGAAAVDVDALVAASQADPSRIVPTIIAGSQAAKAGQASPAQTAAVAALGRRLWLTPERLPGMEQLLVREHTVAAGEYPSHILKRYRMSNGLMKLLNPTYDDRRLGAGQVLKVIDLSQTTLTVLVQRSKFRLVVVAKTPQHPMLLVAEVPVGIGKAERATPLGETTIDRKVLNPEWTHPDTGEVIPPQDERNVLGGYWIGLASGGSANSQFKSIGLHGYTGAPAADWLQQAGSRGCLRLLQADINALYHLLPTGTRVVVID